MEKHVTLKDKLRAATQEAVEAEGGPVTLGRILATVRPVEGYVRDYRDCALEVTQVVAYTLQGDPLRVVSGDPNFLAC